MPPPAYARPLAETRGSRPRHARTSCAPRYTQRSVDLPPSTSVLRSFRRLIFPRMMFAIRPCERPHAFLEPLQRPLAASASRQHVESSHSIHVAPEPAPLSGTLEHDGSARLGSHRLHITCVGPLARRTPL